jgi:hypothetical protein
LVPVIQAGTGNLSFPSEPLERTFSLSITVEGWMSDNPFRGEFDDEPAPFDDKAPPIPASSPEEGSAPAKSSRIEQLKQREAALLARQKQLRETSADIYRAANFPAIYPLIYVNIEEDIPAAARRAVRTCLYALICLTVAATFNVFAVLTVSGLPTYPRVHCLIFGILQGAGLVYFAMNYSYTKVYAACKKRDIPFSVTIWQFALVACCVYLTIGFPSSGSVGLATFLDLIAKSKSGLSIFFAFVNLGLIGFGTALEVFTLMNLQAYQKVSGTDERLLPAGDQAILP